MEVSWVCRLKTLLVQPVADRAPGMFRRDVKGFSIYEFLNTLSPIKASHAQHGNIQIGNKDSLKKSVEHVTINK